MTETKRLSEKDSIKVEVYARMAWECISNISTIFRNQEIEFEPVEDAWDSTYLLLSVFVNANNIQNPEE